ncbi:MAG TPA: hypothetical protein DCX00_06515 [Flavobacteriales bacterium]|nr:hypothetical protein [Flavobacteriales bacterium]
MFLLLFGVVSLVAHAQVPDYVPTEGLVAWYPFNGNANDESGNEQNGEIFGAQLTFDRFASSESAYSFNHTRIEIENSATNDQFKTISFWFMSSSPDGNQVAFKQNIYVDHVYARVNCAIQWNGTHFAGKEVCGAGWQYDNVSSELNDGIWHHYVGILDSAQKRLYIDGNLLDESDFNPENMCSGGDLIIGQEWDGVPYAFIGDLDDFGFWNRALTEEEILALYNAELSAPGCTDPTACNFNAEANEDDGSCEFCSCLSQPTVAAGYGTNYVKNTLGQVYGWGGNNLGQTDIPDTLVGVRQIEGGEEFCILLHADSSVQVIGSNGPYGASVPAGMKGIDISAGRHHMVVVEANGALTNIGPNYAGLPNEPVVSNAVDGAAGWYHNAGVLDNGEVIGWGNAWVEPETPITNAVEIEAGNGHNIVLTSENTIIEWGSSIGSTSVWDTLTNVVDIAAGWNRSLALMNDGTLLAWNPENGSIIIDRDDYAGVIDADIEHNAIIILLESGEILTALDVPAEVETITSGWSNCDLCLADADGDGICNEDEGPCNENPDPCLCDDIVVYGCVDPEACNYASEANCGDESCIYPPLGLSNCYDGETFCGEGTIWDASLQTCVAFDDCPADLNGNGLVEVSDLLLVLADFGTECPPEVAEWTCGDPVSYHGYDYATAQIGEQCWFAENLRTTQFRNGIPITHLQNVENWVDSDIPGWCYYEDAQAQELETFGLIYNFFVVGDNICPSDWHIPNFAEWFEEGGLRSWIAENYPEIDINSGGALKTIGTSEWLAPNEGATNQFDFSGRPSGGRNLSGEFLDVGTEANYHINNTFGGGEAHHVYLKHQSTVFDRASPWQGDSPETWHWGASIRCLKD